MTAKGRIHAIRLSDKIKNNPKYTEKLGIKYEFEITNNKKTIKGEQKDSESSDDDDDEEEEKTKKKEKKVETKEERDAKLSKFQIKKPTIQIKKPTKKEEKEDNDRQSKMYNDMKNLLTVKLESIKSKK